jgi:hypothetical protein
MLQRTLTRAISRRRLGAMMATLVTWSIAVAAGGATQTGSSALGVGKPPGGTGIGTVAALRNVRCDRDAGAFGRFDFQYEGGGGLCVVPFKGGSENNGASARGVTSDSIKLAVVTPSAAEVAAAMGAGFPINRATGDRGLTSDAFVDTIAAYEHAYELWGRSVDVHFVESTGTDEAAQRSDALTVKQLEPFALIDATVIGLDTLDTIVAQAGILVNGSATSTQKALAQAPYRWGLSDSQASAINTAEFAGKQLVGKKARWAGDESLQSRARIFGAIYADRVINIAEFDREFAKYKGTTAQNFPYTSSGSPFGDPQRAQEAAPRIVQKLKSIGATSILMFTDIGMTRAVLQAATTQDYRPEWIITGSQFQDAAFLARDYDQSQWAHAFGISTATPDVADPSTFLSPVAWYWGPHQGTEQVSVDTFLRWFFDGVQAAGPRLTAQMFRQGLFAVPAHAGAATGDPTQGQTAYGRTAGLPYDEYMQLGTDFAPVWYDANTVDASNVIAIAGKGVEWYLDGARRYGAGTWPRKPFTFFDTTGAVVKFTARPVPLVPTSCAGCPSDGGPGTPSHRSS